MPTLLINDFPKIWASQKKKKKDNTTTEKNGGTYAAPQHAMFDIK